MSRMRSLMTACVVAAIVAAEDAPPLLTPPEQATSAPLPPQHPWPGPPGRDEAALDEATAAREERQRRLDAHRQRLLRWQEQERRRLPCASATAAAYREQRLAAKRRSRALGHGCG